MDYETKERLLHIISWNKLLFNNDILLKTPNLEENMRASYIYKKEFGKAISEGLLPDAELIKDMIYIGKWTEEYETQIEGLKKDIYNIRKSLLDLIFLQSKLQHTKSVLRNAEKVLIDKLIKRKNVLVSSAESHASLQSQRYIIFCIAEQSNGEKFWNNSEIFDTYYDLNLINNLRQFYFEQSRLESSVLRELARTEPWRSRWEISKNTGQLFLNTINEWSYNQQELVKWSLVYDSVYSSIDRPSSEIIDDNDLLDSWLIRQSEKIEKGINTSDKTIKSDKQEQFIFSDKEGSRRVYQMNSPAARSKIKARQQILNQNKIVSDQNLPDRKVEIRNMASEMSRNKIKDIRRK